MFNKIKTVLEANGITRIGIIGIEHCEIINKRILPEWAKSVITLCIPYRSKTEVANDGFSEYCRVYDYHKFSSQLYQKLENELCDSITNNFKGFCDHSPINEKLAIAMCGLGVIGKNSLYIDNEYGSFVFIGSIITDVEYNKSPFDVTECINCGKCVSACPNNAIIEKGIDRHKCLSGISQKKTKTDEEKKLLKDNNIVWGCDICQNVCPYNINAKISPISYFSETRTEKIDKSFILSLTDEEFEKYAFAYKGKKLVLDNIDFI